MADDKATRTPADRTRINRNEDHEVRYWTQKWNITKDQLVAAIEAVGMKTDDVAKRLGKTA